MMRIGFRCGQLASLENGHRYAALFSDMTETEVMQKQTLPKLFDRPTNLIINWRFRPLSHGLRKSPTLSKCIQIYVLSSNSA